MRSSGTFSNGNSGKSEVDGGRAAGRLRISFAVRVDYRCLARLDQTVRVCGLFFRLWIYATLWGFFCSECFSY